MSGDKGDKGGTLKIVPITSVSQNPFQHEGVKGAAKTPSSFLTCLILLLLLLISTQFPSSLCLFLPTLMQLESDDSTESVATSRGKFNMALLPLIWKAALS
ncbi:hypothetical protein MtrunA17_Chr1g0170541 [Medicago truncatula]|uniref:Transmembrane protein n=1 Tax=Medicago truncatula TaxID=3880 RepID=A0A396JKQ4_MEDTR|nr:hypothetical protein MtrunA17_Chr1g0170541 [Medicago truncatula]